MRRARALHRFDLIPETWKRVGKSDSSDFSEKERSMANEALAAKSQATGIDISLLRSVYVRGISEFSQMADAPNDLVNRDEWGQARVNSFIRAYNGDPATRATDHDLLNP